MANSTLPSGSLPPLTKEQIKILEQTRQKLVSLTESLNTLQNSLIRSDPLPAWPSLLTQANIVSHHLSAFSAHISTHRPLLDTLSVFPLPSFPGRQHPEKENILCQLLRKKLEPAVEDWVAEGLQEGKKRIAVVDVREQEELCEFAAEMVERNVKGRVWGANYTLEEHWGGIRKVKTGLRRRLVDDSVDEREGKGGRKPGAEVQGEEGEEGDEEEEEEEGESEEEDGDEEMEDIDDSQDVEEPEEPVVPQIPPMPLVDQLRFLTTGVRPNR